MKGPKVICAACDCPTSIHTPLCADCQVLMAEVRHPFCSLCERAFYSMSDVLPPEHGIHKTRKGGHAGRCTANKPSGSQS